MKEEEENDEPFLIPPPCNEIKEEIYLHKENRRHDMLISLVGFIFLIEFCSVGMAQIYLFPQSSEFQIKGQSSSSFSQQNQLISVLMSSIGLVFGIFSGYVNDFVVRKYAFLIYTFPYYINLIVQGVLVVYTICMTHQISEGADNQVEEVRQISIVIQFIWHNVADGIKVVMLLIVLDYFVDHNYYWSFSCVLISFTDFTYFLQQGIYQIIVVCMDHNFYNQEDKEDDDENVSKHSIELPVSFRIPMFGIYLIAGFSSIYFYRRVLAILKERHDLEWQDNNLRDYHFVGKTKNNVFQNYIYLFKKKTFAIYLFIFIIFWNTSYFAWVSSFQNLYFEYYASNNMNVYTPINNVLNPLCSTIFTLILSYQTRNVKNEGESIQKNQELSALPLKEEISKNLNEILNEQKEKEINFRNNNNNNSNSISKLDQYYQNNNLNSQHHDQNQGMISNFNNQLLEQNYQGIDYDELLKTQGKMGRQLDKFLRYSCLAVIVFNFFMLLTNAFLLGVNQFSETIKTIFLILMYICSSFIGTAFNFLYMSSTLKIVQIFKVRSKVLGSALSIVISAIFFFEYIDNQLTEKTQNQNKNNQNSDQNSGTFPTILYSIYFGSNALGLFAMITLHAREYRPRSLRR